MVTVNRADVNIRKKPAKKYSEPVNIFQEGSVLISWARKLDKAPVQFFFQSQNFDGFLTRPVRVEGFSQTPKIDNTKIRM